MHPRPSPIAASLYTLRDMNVDVIIMHGPHGCCFRTGRLLESDGVRVLTTAMAENDFILGASEKLENTLKEAYDMFKPEFIGVVGTCAKTQETQRIEDVHKFSGHIACDCASNSEICIPIKKDDKLVAILDIDSFEFNNFSKEDQAILEKICEFFIPLF